METGGSKPCWKSWAWPPWRSRKGGAVECCYLVKQQGQTDLQTGGGNKTLPQFAGLLDLPPHGLPSTMMVGECGGNANSSRTGGKRNMHMPACNAHESIQSCDHSVPLGTKGTCSPGILYLKRFLEEGFVVQVERLLSMVLGPRPACHQGKYFLCPRCSSWRVCFLCPNLTGHSRSSLFEPEAHLPIEAGHSSLLSGPPWCSTEPNFLRTNLHPLPGLQVNR